MFERYDDQARQLILRTQEEARALKHHYVGAEHLLLALTRDDSTPSAAARTLAAINVTRERIFALVTAGAGETGDWHLPFTPEAREVLDTAWHEAGDDQIGAEHFLLALAIQTEGIAGRVLRAHAAAIQQNLAAA